MSTINQHQQDEASLLERLIFNSRPVVIFLYLLVNVLLFCQATQVRPSTNFEKMIPLEHPFIQKMFEHHNDLVSLNNTVCISIEAMNGDIFTKEYMETLRQIRDEVFYIPGVNCSGLKLLWSPSVRWAEVTEEGFTGDEVIPQTYDGSPRALEELRNNVLESGQIGRPVTNNFKSSIIDVPLLKMCPNPKNQSKLIKLNCRQSSHELEEKVRNKYQLQNPNVKMYIVGFAKKAGDLIDGLVMVVSFFGTCLLITLVLLYWFTKYIRNTIAALITTLMTTLWRFDLLSLVGFGFDPYLMLVPFLVLAIGISYGVQKINGIALQPSGADNALMTTRPTFRRLSLPGMIAILANVVSFTTLLVIDTEVICELVIGASIGVAVIVFANLILLSVAISYIDISEKAVQRSKDDAVRERPFWCLLLNFASSKMAPVSIAIALLMLGGGLQYGKHLKIDDLDQSTPELRPGSRYDLDNGFIIRNYSTSSDALVVMVKTIPEGCSTHQVLVAMDELAWKLEDTEGVRSTIPMVTISRQVIKGMSEDNLKWETLSHNRDVSNNFIARADGLYNADCPLAPLLIFFNGHKVEALDRTMATVQTFAMKNGKDDLQLQLTAGNVGIEAAINEVIEQSGLIILVLVYICVAAICVITFRSFAATLCIVLPLILTSVLGNTLMAALGIGVKVATLPMIALDVGTGVDYGIYTYTRLESFLRMGLPLQEVYYEILCSTGKAVLFTGLCPVIDVTTWVLPVVKFQADTGLTLISMLLWDMFSVLWLLSALARFLTNPAKLQARKASLFAR